MIVQFTNVEAERVYVERDIQVAWNKESKTEILEFIGLIIATGLYKAKNLTYETSWNPEYGIPMFRANMSLMRFKALLRFCDLMINQPAAVVEKKTNLHPFAIFLTN